MTDDDHVSRLSRDIECLESFVEETEATQSGPLAQGLCKKMGIANHIYDMGKSNAYLLVNDMVLIVLEHKKNSQVLLTFTDNEAQHYGLLSHLKDEELQADFGIGAYSLFTDLSKPVIYTSSSPIVDSFLFRKIRKSTVENSNARFVKEFLKERGFVLNIGLYDRGLGNARKVPYTAWVSDVRDSLIQQFRHHAIEHLSSHCVHPII